MSHVAGWGPIELEPILVPRVWGGRRLEHYGRDLDRDLPSGTAVGESWDLADLPPDIPGGRSVIRRGPGAGGTLRELIARDAAGVLGEARPADDGGFPLLVKLLDARADLSVQVHPTPSYAAAHPGARVKSEAWVVLEAEPESRILRGFRPDPRTGERRRSAAHIRAAAADGSIAEDLESIPAIPGECHVLPSGLCHALGAGVLVAEIQTPSDTTFRLFDWGRSGRELHLDAAIASMTGADAPHEPPAPRAAPALSGPPEIVGLAQTEAFDLDMAVGGSGGPLTVSIPHRPVVLVGISGEGRLEGPDGPLSVRPGATVLLPAAFSDAVVTLEPGAHILRAVPAKDGRGP